MCVFIFILWLIIDVNFFNLFKNNWKNPNKYFKSKNVILYLKKIVVVKSYLEHFCCCSHWDPCQLIFRLEVEANESAQVLSLYLCIRCTATRQVRTGELGWRWQYFRLLVLCCHRPSVDYAYDFGSRLLKYRQAAFSCRLLLARSLRVRRAGGRPG